MVAPTGKSPGETKAGRSEHRSVHTTQHAGVTRPVWESPRLGGRCVTTVTHTGKWQGDQGKHSSPCTPISACTSVDQGRNLQAPSVQSAEGRLVLPTHSCVWKPPGFQLEMRSLVLH